MIFSLPCPQAISTPPRNDSRTSAAVVQLGMETDGDSLICGSCPLSIGVIVKDKETNCLLLPRLRSRLPGGGVECGGRDNVQQYVCVSMCLSCVCLRHGCVSMCVCH